MKFRSDLLSKNKSLQALVSVGTGSLISRGAGTAKYKNIRTSAVAGIGFDGWSFPARLVCRMTKHSY